MVETWMLPGSLARAADPALRSGRRTTRDWLVDLTFFAAAVLWAVVEIVPVLVEDVYGLPTWLLVVDPTVAALLCLSLWWRRRFPVALGVAAALVGAVSNMAAGALFVLFFSLALHRGWTRAVPVLALGTVLAIPYVVIYFPRVYGDPLLWSVIVTLLMTVCVVAGLGVRARRQLVLALRARADDLRREHAHRLTEARMEERARIAREMHDVLAHRISLLSVHAGALEFRTDPDCTPPTADEVRAAVGVIRSNAHLALEELQEVLTVLREPGADDGPPQPTADRIPALLDEARAGGQRVRAELTADLAGRSPVVQRTAYRVVQEGLTNARKHAAGAEVVVDLRDGPDGSLSVGVANPVPVGVTAAEIPGAGRGLTGLAERVGHLGGELEAGPRAGWFRLHARIPV